MPLSRSGAVLAKLGQPVVIGAENRRHELRVGHLEVKQSLRRVEDFACHPVELHIFQVLIRIVAPAMDVFEPAMVRDGFWRVKAGPGIGDEPNASDGLSLFHHQMISISHTLQARRPVAEGGINAPGPQVRWLEHMGVRGNNQLVCHSNLHLRVRPLLHYLDMRLGGGAGDAVDRYDILRAGGKGQETIHLGAQQHVVAWLTQRRLEGQPAIGLYRNVHEQIPRTWCRWRLHAEFGQGCSEVIGAIVVVLGAAKQGIAVAVTGGYQRVMYPRRGILYRVRIGRRWLVTRLSPTRTMIWPRAARVCCMDMHSCRSVL